MRKGLRSQPVQIDLTTDTSNLKRHKKAATEPRQTRKQVRDEVWQHVQVVQPPPAPPLPTSAQILCNWQIQRVHRAPNKTYSATATYADPDIYKCPYCYAPNFYTRDACNSLTCVNCRRKFCVICCKGFLPGESFHSRCGIYS